MGRKCNAKGLAIIKRFEGLELTAYRCPAGKLTIGYGSTGSHVKEGMVITEPEAEALLKRDVARFATGVEALIGDAPTTGDQFSALVSFAFNLGLQALLKSTLLKRHKAGRIAEAADQFLAWNKARVHGQLVPLKGLTRRREAESALYRGEVA
jgi:lysozyme